MDYTTQTGERKHLSFGIMMRTIIHSFTRKQWVAFSILFGLLTLSLLSMLYRVNERFLVAIPKNGGTFHEGLVGIPRFINPVLALSDADKDMTTLIYGGLMAFNSEGKLVTNIAQSYDVSANGLTYTFVIRKDAIFHDGKPITADDVVYTIKQLKDPLVKSPRAANWEGVSVDKQDAQTVVFTLKQRYPRFLENMTLGILPVHIWKDLTPEQFSLTNLNTQPIGSGPYQIENAKESKNGLPLSYTLKSFKHYPLGKAHISKINITFFDNEKEAADSFKSGKIDGIGALSGEVLSTITSKHITKETPLPRLFGIFFNPNQNALFRNREVISALNLVIDRNQIIHDVLYDHGTPISGPAPVAIGGTQDAPTVNLDQAATLLKNAGWTKDASGVWIKKSKKQTEKLSFSLATSDVPELKATAQKIKEEIENFGGLVDLQIYEVGTLNQNTITPRKYEALFFGQNVSHETDLFAFWHSSQRNAPGLNITLYANPRVDKILESMNDTLDDAKRANLVQSFENEISKDMPVVYVYSPNFVYVLRHDVPGLSLAHINMLADRFSTITNWYIETQKVWKFLVH